MAGAGRRVFTPGEVLTASNVMNYLQDQSVMNFAGTAARGSAIGSAVAEGMVSYLADSNLIETYDGSVWERQTGGLIPVSPSSVVIATGSGSANVVGEVSFSGATTVSLNNVFTSTYSNYFILYEGISSVDTGITMRLRAGGTDNSAANSYSTARTYNTNATVGANQGLNTLYTIFPVSYQKHLFTFNLYKPALAVNTHGICNASSNSTNAAATNWGIQTGHMAHYVASAFDGFTLIATTGNITGTVQVFGYNN